MIDRNASFRHRLIAERDATQARVNELLAIVEEEPEDASRRDLDLIEAQAAVLAACVAVIDARLREI